MLDIKTILLIASGVFFFLLLLAIVIGLLSGLRKQLKCTIITAVLLIAVFVFYKNQGAILNRNITILGGFVDLPDGVSTLWDFIYINLTQSIPNGADMFAVGSEAYNVLHSITAAVVNGVALMVSIIVMYLLIFIVNFFVIVCTKKRHKKQKKSGLNRLGGAGLAALRLVLYFMIILAPISFASGLLSKCTPETRQLIINVAENGLNITVGDTEESSGPIKTSFSIVKVDDEKSLIEQVFELNDAYSSSAIGIVVSGGNSSKSLSSELFTNAFVVQKDGKNFSLADQIYPIVEAVNSLDGDLNLTTDKIKSVAECLKEVDLLPYVVPAVVEAVANSELADTEIMSGVTLKDLITVDGSTDAFVESLKENLEENFDKLIDAAVGVYVMVETTQDLDYSNMNIEELKEVIGNLSDSGLVDTILNTVLPPILDVVFAELKLDISTSELDLSKINWKHDFFAIADAYDDIQKLGLLHMPEDVKGYLVTVLNDPTKNIYFKDLLTQLLSLDTIGVVGNHLFNQYLGKLTRVTNTDPLLKTAFDFSSFDTAQDATHYYNALLLAKDVLAMENFDPSEISFELVDSILDELLATQTFNRILSCVVTVVLNLEEVQSIYDDRILVINTANIDWKNDFFKLIKLYDFVINDAKLLECDDAQYVSDLVKNRYSDIKKIVGDVASMTVVKELMGSVIDSIVSKVLNEKYPAIAPHISLKDYTGEEFSSDVLALFDVVYNLAFATSYNKKVNPIEAEDAEYLGNMVTLLLNLNIVKDDAYKNEAAKALIEELISLEAGSLDSIDLYTITMDDLISFIKEKEYEEQASYSSDAQENAIS